MWIRGALLAAALALSSSPAAAGFMDGNTLIDRCKNKGADAYGNYGQCLGYIMGVADVMHYNLAPVFGTHACPAMGVTDRQLEAVVMKWLDAHPENWHLNASNLVAMALHEAFPCK